MKTILILVLLVALVGGAGLSRPSETSFKDYYTANVQNQNGGGGGLGDWLGKLKADSDFKDLKYRNYLVCATVEKEGKVAYWGLFSRWFKASAQGSGQTAK